LTTGSALPTFPQSVSDVREFPPLKPLQHAALRWSSNGTALDVLMFADSHVILRVSGPGLSALRKIVTGVLQSFTGQKVSSGAGAALA
jgi:hypothetical protein